MTLLEAIKKLLGNNADLEISETEETKTDENKEKDGGEMPPTDETKETETDSKDTDTEEAEAPEEAEEKPAMFSEGWFNRETKEIDASKINNPEALEAIQMMQAEFNAERESRLIAESLNDELKNYSLNVSDETFRKVLDTSNIKVTDGKVTGVKEAIEALKTSEPTMFKDMAKESNPLNEGFNPVEKATTTDPKSFSQAFSMMEE